MPTGTFLLVTVVSGLLLVGVGVVIARHRRHDAPAVSRVAVRASDTGTIAVVVATVAVVAAAGVAGAEAVVFAGLAALVFGFFAWGVYSLGRSRGLPRAHSVGLSAWLFGVVLIGVIAVKLLVT